MKKALLLLLTLVCTSARGQQHEFILNLLSQMTIEEKVDLLHATSPGVPHLGVSKYYMGNEALFGDFSPAGRLPLTFYNSMDELPDFNDYDVTKGRTYQYFQGTPLYSFGHGLSYTRFQYRNLRLQHSADEVTV